MTDQIFGGPRGPRPAACVFDGFVAVDDVDLDRPARRPAVPDRAQRRRQDHHGGRDHRAGEGDRLGHCSASSELLGRKVHQIARLGRRADLPDRDRVRGADVLQNLDIAAGCRPGGDDHAAPPRTGLPDAVAAGAGDDRADRARARPAGRDAGARPEAVAGDRHAAGPGRQAAAAGRAGGRDEPRRAGRHRRAARRDRRGPHGRGHRARHGLPAPLRPHASPCCTPARCSARGRWPRSRPTRGSRRSTSDTPRPPEECRSRRGRRARSVAAEER